MGKFLEQQKNRLALWKADESQLPQEAQRDGLFPLKKGKKRPFCLPPEFTEYNLYPDIRDDIIVCFQEKEVKWHGGSRPSHHLCDSQICCANFLFPFADKPVALAELLRPVFPSIREMLPAEDGRFVALEWIGERDYLGEMEGRRNKKRNRGANCTSADAMVRFARQDGSCQTVLIEWKYCESYHSTSYKTARKSNKNRVDIYRKLLEAEDCPIEVKRLASLDDLFFEPFYQLMRQQLLAHEMEKAHEQGAHRVTVLHIDPEHNQDFCRVTSPRLSSFGESAIAVWESLVKEESRFDRISTESLFGFFPVAKFPELSDWRNYIEARYAELLSPTACTFSPHITQYEIYDHPFEKLVRRAFSKIPARARAQFPDFSIDQGSSVWGAHVRPGSVTFDVSEIRRLCGGDESAIIGIIGHELAHVYCHHCEKDLSLQWEHEADEVVSSWGFRDEVAAMRRKLGPATMQIQASEWDAAVADTNGS